MASPRRTLQAHGLARAGSGCGTPITITLACGRSAGKNSPSVQIHREGFASGHVGVAPFAPERFLDAVSEGNDPTAQDKATVDAQIKHHEIKVFVYNRPNATPDVKAIVKAAKAAGIPVATVTETLVPAGATPSENPLLAGRADAGQPLRDARIERHNGR